MRNYISSYGKWVRQGIVACGVGSILVLGGCELGAPPIEEQKDEEPQQSLVDQYKQANKESRDPGLAANPKALAESAESAGDEMPAESADMGGDTGSAEGAAEEMPAESGDMGGDAN